MDRIPEGKLDTLVIGIGNTLLQDEGVGVRVIEALRQRDLPPTVELVDGGIGGLNLLDLLANRRKVIVIDSACGGEPPGSVYRFAPNDVKLEACPPTSLHQLGIMESLDIVGCLGPRPGQVVIFGVEPRVVNWGLDLSPEVAAVVPRVVAMVLDEVAADQDAGARYTRAHIAVRGLVQGVGFRPHVYRIARLNKLSGWVLNSTQGVEIEVEGTPQCIESFLSDVTDKAPPLACIDEIDVHYLPPVGYSSFTIEASHTGADGVPLISPDIATCPDCLAEMFDANDRRFRYPFINCTNCGPRVTIVESVPYDRPGTTMSVFTMCRSCQIEYETPSNRRFHAQPNACPACGPSIWLVQTDSCLPVDIPKIPNGQILQEPSFIAPSSISSDYIDAARALLQAGKILAIKGLGGFHLACDARSGQAVYRLRTWKQRAEKPLAIMVHDLETARRLCRITDTEAQLLISARRPIVLLQRQQQEQIAPEIAPEVAPGNQRFGVMLPYTPLHHLLFESTEDNRIDALVMTSGNLSEEPIAKDNDEALSKLGSLADYFLLHDRKVHARCDDSVTQVVEGSEMIIRRSRGYAPLPLRLNFQLEPVLACGADLKNTFCVTKTNYAFLSQHIGDLESPETLDFLSESVDHMIRVLDLLPKVIAHDLHPDYVSTRYALSCRMPSDASLTTTIKVAVQHHHAHIASCMAENALREPVIGVAFDGTGYGSDGTIWGGEFLVADYLGFERAAHLKCVPLPGGDAAIRRPYRVAYSYLLDVFGQNLPRIDLLTSIDPGEADILRNQIAKNVNSPMSSSCGRLFDAVSALLGIRNEITYEGQAAIELEMAAEEDVLDAYRFDLTGSTPIEIDWTPVIRSIVTDVLKGDNRGVISARFHNGVAQIIAEVCSAIRLRSGLRRVCLSGGVFHNRFLLGRTLHNLRREGFEVYTHHLVPCNDGGVSLGQAIVASERVKAGLR